MKYENMPCPVCGSHMHEGDDIVVCPDCGTPCHRECWKETGHCINEEKHSEGFTFVVAPKEDEINAAPPQDIYGDMIACHICGSENPVTSRNCNHCGALLQQINQGGKTCPICRESIHVNAVICPHCGASLMPATQQPLRAYNPFNGNDPDEKLGDNSVGEVAAYLKINQGKYIKKFHNIENHEKVNFNFSAFFFGPLWFLFRKMFLYGLVLMMAFACLSLMLVPSSEKALAVFYEYSPEIAQYNEIITSNKSATDEETGEEITVEEATERSIELQTVMFKKVFAIIKKPVLIVIAVMLFVDIICGFYADGLYYKKIKKDLEAVKSEVPDNNVRMMLISRRGGVSVLNIICGIFIYDLFQSVAATIADYVSNMF